MSCYSSCYLPIPSRNWSRTQNSCSLTTDIDNNELVKVPYTNEIVSISILGEKVDMLNKGNVLQYKYNSSHITQAQKYSKIAQGQWTNRNTTWATQGLNGYSNPNTTSLKRSGNSINIAIDPITGAIIGPTTAPITCLKPITTINEALPSNGGGGSIIEPEIPPIIPPTPESNTFPAIIPDTPIDPIVIQDGGNLICFVQENVCTGEIKYTSSQQLCNPTTDSDVPGPIQLLCWNDGIPSWYPKQRYIMNSNSNSSIGKNLYSAIRPSPPVITSITNDVNTITLTWTQDEICLPVSRFNIYQNGVLIRSLPSNIFTINFDITNCGTYDYFIVALTNGSNINSAPSNIVSVNINVSSPPQSVIVNWASADSSFEIMDINMNFTTPLSIRCGNPIYFVVNVRNSNDVIIAAQQVTYSSTDTYEVNFNDVSYTATGSVDVYLVTVNPNGTISRGDSATYNFTSSALPIFINSQINSDRTELSFNVITQTDLREIGAIIYPNPNTSSLTTIHWNTEPPGISPYLIISKQRLSNNEIEYSFTIYPGLIDMELIDLTSFPSPLGFAVSNTWGIQSDMF